MYIYFSYRPLVYLMNPYWGTYEVEWFYDQWIIKKEKVCVWKNEVVTYFEVLSPNLPRCIYEKSKTQWHFNLSL